MAKIYPKRYHEYRGRRRQGGNPVLKILIALLALILAAAIVFVFVLGGSVEYTDEGVRLVFPWSEDPQEEPSVTPSPSQPVIVIEPEPSVEPTPTPAPEPEHPAVIGAVEVSVPDLLDGSAAALVAEVGGDALVVEVKSSTGKVFWDSPNALTAVSGEEGAALREAVEALAADGELHLVARVVCFRDPELAAAGIGGPLKTKGGNMWYDRYGVHWVSPASKEVRDYLLTLLGELADMGFDEILLECAGYPYFGETHVLATDELRPDDLTVPVSEFLGRVRELLDSKNVQTSLLVTEEMVLWLTPTGTGTTISGITPELMAQYAHRVWVKAVEGTDYAQVPASAPLVDRLVILGGPGAGSWADVDDPVR